MPCGCIIKWNCKPGFLKLTEGRLKAKCGQSCLTRGIVKKQSFKSTIIICQPRGMAEGKGNPCWRGPIGCITSLTALRSCNSLHFPDFFLMINMGVFQGEVEGTMCPACSWSWTKAWAACNFSWVKGHCSTQTGSSDFQVIGIGAGLGTVTLTKNGLDRFGLPAVW